MTKHKFLIVTVLILLTSIVNYAIPKPHYIGTGFISNLKIPDSIGEWHGNDVSSALELDFDKDWNKFISEAIAYQYINSEGEKLLFIILDAGNFHNPKVCYTSAGFEIKELDDTEFRIANHSVTAHTLHTEKANDKYITFYWIIIDKKIAHNWVEQKFKQLYFSLFNKKRVGLMVRIDISAKEYNIEHSTMLAKQFIEDISQILPNPQRDFIFGVN